MSNRCFTYEFSKLWWEGNEDDDKRPFKEVKLTIQTSDSLNRDEIGGHIKERFLNAQKSNPKKDPLEAYIDEIYEYLKLCDCKDFSISGELSDPLGDYSYCKEVTPKQYIVE